MSNHVTHDEYVSLVRRQAAVIATGIIAGDEQVLEGCHKLASLRWEAEVGSDDPDFSVFAMISSETDALPVGAEKGHWATDAMARIDAEIQLAIVWAMPLALPACESVVRRFGALSHPSPDPAPGTP